MHHHLIPSLLIILEAVIFCDTFQSRFDDSLLRDDASKDEEHSEDGAMDAVESPDCTEMVAGFTPPTSTPTLSVSNDLTLREDSLTAPSLCGSTSEGVLLDCTEPCELRGTSWLLAPLEDRTPSF
jgi:hypothetical protein